MLAIIQCRIICLSVSYPKISILRHTVTILVVVLYGCETWSFRKGEKSKLRVIENRVVGRTFGPKRDDVTGEWRKLHNEELSALYSLPNIIQANKSRRMTWVEHVVRMLASGSARRILVRIPDEKRQFGKSRPK